ncbi:MAG: hypothetical protein PUG48_10890 [Clostridia bacterium]|nr:hypothetical protein [Clostridia bacterium]
MKKYINISMAVNNWLDEHPEATTTVQGKSLTYDKLVVGTLGYVTPEMFGAVGDGIADDTTAFNECVQFANTKKVNIELNNSYLLSGDVKVSCNIIGQNSVIIGINRLWIEGSNINVSGLTFKSSVKNSIFIHDSENIMISNCEVKCEGFAIAIECSTDIILKNIKSNQSTDGTSNDFIHLYKGSKNINIINCNGTSNDDFIAINAVETSGESTDKFDFDIENVMISNCSCNAYSAVRLYTHDDRKINNVYISNCNFVTTSMHAIRFTNASGSGSSSNSNAVIKNIKFSNCSVYSTGSYYCVNFAYNSLQGIEFNGCYFNGEKALIRFNELVDGNVKFDNCVFDNGDNSQNCIILFGTGNLDLLVTNCSIKHTSSTPLFQIYNTSVPTNVTIRNIKYLGNATIVYVDGGIGNLNIDNIITDTAIVVNIGGTPNETEYLNCSNISCNDVAPIRLRSNRTNLSICAYSINNKHISNLQGNSNYEGIRFVCGVRTARTPTIAVKGDSYIHITDTQLYGLKIYNGSEWISII